MAWQPSYVSVAELASFVRIGDAVDDVQLGLAIGAASRSIDRHCNRQFGVVAAAEERSYTACWDRRRGRWLIHVDDLMTVTGLTVTVDAGAIEDFVLEPVNAAQKARPWETLVVSPESAVKPSSDEYGVTVEALWGWTTVPDPVKQATLLQASRLFSRRGSPYGIAGSPEQGSELRLLARVDVDVAVSLGPFTRWWGAA